MINNNPVRCAAEGCAFYAVVLGGYCEECEVEAHADWLDWNAHRAEVEAMEHLWSIEQELRVP